MTDREVKHTACSCNIKPWIPVHSNLINGPHLTSVAFVLAATQTRGFTLFYGLLLRWPQQFFNFLPLVPGLFQVPALKFSTWNSGVLYKMSLKKQGSNWAFPWPMWLTLNKQSWFHVCNARKCYVCQKDVWCWPCLAVLSVMKLEFHTLLFSLPPSRTMSLQYQTSWMKYTTYYLTKRRFSIPSLFSLFFLFHFSILRSEC